MRYVPALAFAVTALFLMAAVPFVATDSSADPDPDPIGTYVNPDDQLNLCGYITGYDASAVAPIAYMFVVHKEIVSGNEVYYYTNVNEDPKDGTPIKATVDSNNMFSIVIPRINTTAEYYLCFDTYSIKTVPWTNAEKRSIVPDTTFPSGVTATYTAYKIPHDTLWSDTTEYPSYNKYLPTANQIWITDDKNTDPGLIGLERSMGEIIGHVSTMIRGDQNDLADVRVELFNKDGKQVAYTNTNSSGEYTLKVATGSYTLTYNRGNYTHEPVEIEVIEGTNKAPEVTMDLEMDNSYFGYDLVHFMMFIGAGICVLIVMISIGFQYKRMKKNKSGKEWILDDMPEKEE